MSNIDQDILQILIAYRDKGRKLRLWDVINPQDWDPPQGGLLQSHYFISHAENLKLSGRWKHHSTERVGGHGSNPVMYKHEFKFIPGTENLVITVYSLDRIEGGENKKAICATRREGN